MKNKFLLSIVTLFLGAFFFSGAYASWVYTDNAVVNQVVQVNVPEWIFDSPTTPGTVIEVDPDGTVLINGEPAEAVIDADGDMYNYGDVTVKVEVNEDGEFVLTEFTTSNISFALLGSTIYLPTAVEVDGETYPVTGIAEPLDINVSDPVLGWFYSNSVYIPDTYTYICDNAFATLTQKTTFNIPTSIESIGHGAFMPGRNVTQTLAYKGTQSQWNQISKPSDYENGAGSVSITYNN